MSQDGYFSSYQTAQSLYSSFTTGSVIFQGTNFLAQNNALFFWDNTNYRLGIGTNTPTSSLQIVNNTNGSVVANITNSNTGSSNNIQYTLTNDSGAYGQLALFGNTFAGLPALQNVTRLAGTSGVWIASDVSNASGGTDPISFSVGGYNNITAQATTNGLTAINITDTGIPASASGAPLTITSGQVLSYGLVNYQVSSSTATTVTTTAAILSGATVTPAAGTYLIIFSCNATASSAGGNTLNVELLVGGTAQADTLRQATPTSASAFSAFQYMNSGFNKIITVNGSQAIAVQGQTTAGTVTITGYDLSIVRIA
jgi:hypothetical protein